MAAKHKTEQENKIHNLEIEKKEQQLANSAIHLATQTELLGNFRNKLRAIVRCCQDLEQSHVFQDGNIRTIVFLP